MACGVLGGPVVGHVAAEIDLSRLVVVGDSLSAGFQSARLVGSQQVHGYPALIATQADVGLVLPLIAEPGAGQLLTLDPGPPPAVIDGGPVFALRVDPFTQPTNVAVPGATVGNALTALPTCPPPPDFDPIMTFLVLGFPQPCLGFGVAMSQIEQAEALQPTTILVWLGSNDALQAAIGADAALLTPVADFRAAYTEALGRLALTGATLVVGNVPDATLIPFLTAAEAVLALVAAQTGLDPAVIAALLGIGPGEFVIPDALPLIQGILLGTVPPPLPPGVVVTAAEVATINQHVAAYNDHIAVEAAKHGAALVDIRGLFDEIRARGLVVGGQRLTTDFLGGLFSLDGIHPTNTGYAVIANAFIRAMNRHFGAGIPPVALRQVQKADPLVLPGVGHPPSALGQVSPETAATLRALLQRR
jgi:phospholipase/lecithinase/hemolysin